MAPTDPAADPPDYSSIGEQIGAGLLKLFSVQGVQKAIVSANVESKGAFIASAIKLMEEVGVAVGKGLVNLEEPVMPLMAGFCAAIVGNLFGTEINAAAFANRDRRGDRGQAADAIVDAVMGAIAGGSTDQSQPGPEGARRIAAAAVHASIEGWFNGIVPEVLGELIPIDWLHFSDFAELGEDVIRALGVGRLVRRALAPLVDATAATPMKWHVSRIYRQTLLSPSDAIRQFLRGRWTVDQMREELARAGYSDERIDALTNAQQKFFSAADVRTFVDREFWSRDQGLQHLRDQGYDEDTAGAALRLEGLHRLDQLEGQEATAIISAYASGDIERADCLELLNAHVSTAPERALLTELADLRRSLNIKHLSASQAEAAVKANILAVSDYRAALRREGYDEDSVLTLELLLRWELDKQTTIDDQRAKAAADRAAEKAARDQAAAAKRAQVAADQALARRGSAGVLERAVVRGLIPIARYQEALDPKYDADTVEILVGLVEQERADYVALQQKAADVKKAAANRNIDVGSLETAVREHTLSIDEFRARLAYLKFSDADAALLTSTLQAKLADEAAAAQTRAEAAAKASAKRIDLNRFEQLVRRGHRTIQEYTALLASLGYDDADQAAMAELLQLKINDDAAAASARALIDAQRKPGALTIAQFRRAVILGVKTSDQFDSFLTSLGVSPDQHALFMAELADDVSQADAARQRRAVADARTDARALSLSTVRQAARLGIITPATYQQRLEAAGYSADDVAIDLDLLLLEIGDVQGARQAASAADLTVPAKELTLAQIASAVKHGESTLEEYRSRAIALGLAADDADTITRVLADEVSATKAAKARRDQLAGALAGGTTTIAGLEDQVRAGALTVDDYIGQLVQLGISLEDADLLGSLLSDELNGGGVTV